MSNREYLVVDRRNRTYAFFSQESNQQLGNWMAYHDDQEPERIAKEHEIELRELP